MGFLFRRVETGHLAIAPSTHVPQAEVFFLVILITVVGLVDINTALKIGVDATAAAMIIGLLVYVTRIFK